MDREDLCRPGSKKMMYFPFQFIARLLLTYLHVKPAPGLTMPADPVSVLSADVGPDLAQANAASLVPHATLAFKSPSPAPAWADSALHGGLAYLMCTEDQAIPRSGQEAMMEATGQEWIVKELRGSHNAPFLTKPQEAVEAVDIFVQHFLRKAARNQ